MPGRAGSTAAGLLAAAVVVVAGANAAPAAGRYAGELCVGTGKAAPSCGAAEVELRRGGRLDVRISDIVYRLQLHSSQVEVVLMHGLMQIDGFTTDYEWVGRSLQFVDREREARYELRLAAGEDRAGAPK